MTAPERQLLHYRPWHQQPQSWIAVPWAIARLALLLIFRLRIFWLLLALAALSFFFFFYAQYLLVWISQHLAGETVRIAGIPFQAANLLRFLDRLALNGSAQTFANFIWFQGYILVILLAFSGSLLFGNDLVHGSLTFYLAKPITLSQYLLGKCLAIALLVLLITLVPSFILWLEAGLLYDWRTYYWDNLHLLVGMAGYCACLTLTLSLLTAAAGLLLRRTVPLVLVWMGLFVLLRMMANWLTYASQDPCWRLLDLWNNLYLCGLWCLDVDHATVRPLPQPDFLSAFMANTGVIVTCLLVAGRQMATVTNSNM